MLLPKRFTLLKDENGYHTIDDEQNRSDIDFVIAVHANTLDHSIEMMYGILERTLNMIDHYSGYKNYNPEKELAIKKDLLEELSKFSKSINDLVTKCTDVRAVIFDR